MSVNTPVAHGYTMGELGKIARAACTYDRSMASDATTRYDVAWSAIAEALCAATEPPSWHELFTIGWQAIYAEVREMRHMYGQRVKDGTNAVASSPRFRQYWTVPPARPEDGMTERLAVAQVLAVLRPVERDAVVALAVHDDYQAAADALGITYAALVSRLGAARRRFRGHWYAPETAPPTKGTDRRVGAYGRASATHCQAGHEWAPENTRWARGRGGGSASVRRCRECERLRSKARRRVAGGGAP